ncbi:MAG: hypothetical protein V7750_18720 [Sneathiella sp.]
MRTLFKSAAIALAIGFVSMTVQAATISYTEGKREQVAGTTVVSPTDANNAPPGYDLGTIGFGEANDTIDLYGRIVNAVDVFSFTSNSAFRIDFIFGGFDLENGGSTSESGFIAENNDNSSDFTLNILAPSIGSVGATTLATDITSGISFIFGGDAGTYQFALDGTGGAARYDIRISAVPLPAGLPLMGAGLALMGFVAWNKKRKAKA